MSMDNPEYILDSKKAIGGGRGGRSGGGHLKFPPNSHHSGNYHTLGIPLVNNSSPSHSSSQGPSSIQSAPPATAAAGPYSSITSTGSGGHEVGDLAFSKDSFSGFSQV